MENSITHEPECPMNQGAGVCLCKAKGDVLALLARVEAERKSVVITLEEGERQAVVLSLGRMAAERPAWVNLLGRVADKLEGRDMYEMTRSGVASKIAGQADYQAEIDRVTEKLGGR